jgi:phosphatidate cytidylyltransferase
VNCLQGADKQNNEMGIPEPEKQNNHRSSVGQRWLTASIAIPVVLLFGWFGGWAAFVAALLVVVLCSFEMHSMLAHVGHRPLVGMSLGLGILFLVAAMLPLAIHLLVLEIGLGAALLISFPWLFLRKKYDGALIDWALTLAIPIYLGWPMSSVLLLRGNDPVVWHPAAGGWISLPPGAWWLLTALLGVWFFDGAAFFSGRYWGRHKLAPLISPGKTWEGVVGGFIFCMIVCLMITVIPLGLPWYFAILLAILIGSAATLGDLAESLIKRQTNVKDSGQMMPGHGGLLDRVDSLLFAFIIVSIFSQVMQLVK